MATRSWIHTARRSALRAAAIASLMPALALSAVAQEAEELEASIRVRVTVRMDSPVPRTFAGSVSELVGDTLRLRTENAGLRAFPLASIERLEVWSGTKGRSGRGALIGATLGGLSLGLVAAADAASCSSWCFVSPGAAFGAGFVLGALPGAAIGALIGAGAKRDVWEERSPPRPLQPALRLETTSTGPGLVFGGVLRL